MRLASNARPSRIEDYAIIGNGKTGALVGLNGSIDRLCWPRFDNDASLLLIPATGFLAAHDPRVVGTVEAIEKDLLSDGFVLRYRSEAGGDGVAPGEGAFLPCSFWLVNAYKLQGRDREARDLFEKLVGLSNDLGLLSEEYDPAAGRLVGNFPQSFSHLALISSALMLDGHCLGRADETAGLSGGP